MGLSIVFLPIGFLVVLCSIQGSKALILGKSDLKFACKAYKESGGKIDQTKLKIEQHLRKQRIDERQIQQFSEKIAQFIKSLIDGFFLTLKGQNFLMLQEPQFTDGGKDDDNTEQTYEEPSPNYEEEGEEGGEEIDGEEEGEEIDEEEGEEIEEKVGVEEEEEKSHHQVDLDQTTSDQADESDELPADKPPSDGLSSNELPSDEHPSDQLQEQDQEQISSGLPTDELSSIQLSSDEISFDSKHPQDQATLDQLLPDQTLSEKPSPPPAKPAKNKPPKSQTQGSPPFYPLKPVVDSIKNLFSTRHICDVLQFPLSLNINDAPQKLISQILDQPHI